MSLSPREELVPLVLIQRELTSDHQERDWIDGCTLDVIRVFYEPCELSTIPRERIPNQFGDEIDL